MDRHVRDKREFPGVDARTRPAVARDRALERTRAD